MNKYLLCLFEQFNESRGYNRKEFKSNEKFKILIPITNITQDGNFTINVLGKVATKPVFVKLTPNVTDITWIANAVERAGADGFAAINTVQGFMGVNLDTLEPNLCIDGKSTYGGLSGEAVKPIGFRCVAQLRQNSNLPILGMGGISNWEDAAQYIMLGADAVQICTEVMINGYEIINRLKSGLLNYLESKGFNDISELKNIAISKITTHQKGVFGT